MSFDPERAWYVWRHYNPSSADDPRAAWLGGVRHGMRMGVDVMTEFRPLLPLLERLVELLEDRRVEREAVDMVAGEVSPSHDVEVTERADRLASDADDEPVRPGRRGR